MKNIFKNEDGSLEIGGCGKLAKIEDVLEHTAMTGEIFQGVIQLRDSVYSYFDNLGNSESIQDVGEICEYIKQEHIKTLYMEMLEDTQEVEEIMSVNLSDNDLSLQAITRHTWNNNTTYIHNYTRVPNGEIDKNTTVISCPEMFKGLFVH